MYDQCIHCETPILITGRRKSVFAASAFKSWNMAQQVSPRARSQKPRHRHPISLLMPARLRLARKGSKGQAMIIFPQITNAHKLRSSFSLLGCGGAATLWQASSYLLALSAGFTAALVWALIALAALSYSPIDASSFSVPFRSESRESFAGYAFSSSKARQIYAPNEVPTFLSSKHCKSARSFFIFCSAACMGRSLCD